LIKSTPTLIRSTTAHSRFKASETGSDFAEYLPGIASTYEQGDAAPFQIRSKYIGLFGQHSRRFRANLTLNYACDGTCCHQ